MILAILNLCVALLPPISSIQLTVWEEMLFKDFQDGWHGCHFGYWNGMIFAILNLHVVPMPPTIWAQSNLGFGSRCGFKIFKLATQATSFEEFQDGHHGSHLGYWNGMILAILNLYVALIPPIKFRLNLTYGLGGDVVWRISRWLPCRWS